MITQRNILGHIAGGIIILLLATSCSLISPRGLIDSIDDIDGTSGTLSDFFGSGPVVELSAPEAVDTTKGEFTDQIIVSWSAVPDADCYEISRSLDDDDKFLQLGTSYTHSFSDDSVDKDSEAVYKVRAYCNDADHYSPWSSASSPGYLLKTPGNFLATKGRTTDKIVLTWDEVKGVGGYLLYANTFEICPNEPYAVLSEIDSSFNFPVSEDHAGIRYYFWIRSVNNRKGSAKQQSALSARAMGFSLVPGAPPYPEDVTASLGSETDGILVEWEDTGADYYNIYRWSEDNSQQENIAPEGIETIQYHDQDSGAIKPGVRYFYIVQAVSIEGEGTEQEILESGFSDPAEGYILSAPQTISAYRKGNDATINWQGVPGLCDAAEKSLHTEWGYRIEEATDPAGPFTPVGELIDPVVSGPTIFNRTNAPSPAFYRVITDNGSLKSSPSEIVEPSPDIVQGVKAGCNDIPSEGEDPNEAGIYPVCLTWGKTAGASTYRIERATETDGKFTRIGETSSATFSDTTGDRGVGKKYCYRVSAVNNSGICSEPSSSVDGYGAITDSVFLITYNTSSILPSKAKLPIGELEEKTANGEVSGTVYYKAQMSPAGAVMKYTDYCDSRNNRGEPYFVLNGNMDTIISNVLSKSGVMKGTVVTEGMYPGKVIYDEIIIDNGRDAGGTYGVQQQGRPTAQLSWELLK